jgi:hypothetical protein
MQQQEFNATTYEIQCTLYMLHYGACRKYGIDIDYPHMAPQEQQELVTKIQSVRTNEDLFNTPLFLSNKTKYEDTVEKLSVGNKSAVGPPCPRCGTNMFRMTVQRNASDEAMKNELHCPSCNLVRFE